MKIEHYFTGPLQVNCYLVYDDTKKAFIVDPGGFSQALADSVAEKHPPNSSRQTPRRGPQVSSG